MSKKKKKEYKVVKERSGLTSSIADCETCGWRAESKNAVGLAAIHTKHTGHRTMVESAMMVHFIGK